MSLSRKAGEGSSMLTSGEKAHRAIPVSGTSGVVRPTKWATRELQRHKLEQMKAKEREMKEAKESGERMKREARMERRKKKEERERIEEMSRRMSGKKLDRKRRRLGLTKKVAH